MEKSHKRNFDENLFLFKGCGNPRASSDWALCAGLVGYSMFYWLLKKTLRRAESGFEFTLHPQHFVILKLSIWEVMLFMETEDGTPARMPHGEKHGGKWVKPTWLLCEQSHRKSPFYSTLGEILPNDTHRTCLFLVSSVVEVSIMHLPLPLRPP